MREDIGRGKARIEENKVKEKRKKIKAKNSLMYYNKYWRKKGVFDVLKQLGK